MNKRLEFHELLSNIIGENNVYFQPPSSIKIKYPCIIYSKDGPLTKYSDDLIYSNRQSYLIYYIRKEINTEILKKIENLQFCKFNRSYTLDNLYYDVYKIYY